MLALQSTPLIGLPQLSGWSQVVVSPDHRLRMAFAVSGQNAGNVGRDVLTWLESQSVQNSSEVHTLLTQLLSFVHTKGCDVQVVLLWRSETAVVFGAVHGYVILKRHDKLGILLQSQGEIRLVEGRLQPDDMIVLLTQQAGSYAGEIQQKLLAGYDLDTTVASLVPSLHAQSDSSLSACWFMQVGASDEVIPVVRPESAQLLSVSIEPDEKVVAPDPVVVPPVVYKQNAVAKKILSPLRFIVQFFHAKKHKPLMSFRQPKLTAKTKTVAMGVIVLLVIGVGMGIWWKVSWANQATEAQQAVQILFDKLQVAESQVESEPLVARQTAADVLIAMNQLNMDFEKKPGAQKTIDDAAQSIQARAQQISGQTDQAELPVFYDARLLQSDFITSLAVASGETAWLVDTDKRQALLVSVATKQAQAVDLTKMAKIKSIAVDGDTIWFLGDGIWQTSFSSPTEIVQVRAESDSNRDATLIAAYNTYVYVVNPVKRNIYRYAKNSDNQYGEPIGWLKSSKGLDLEKTVSMSIDGDVWLGQSDGQIVKLTTGSVVDFEVKGASESLTHFTRLIASQEKDVITVLEPDSQRALTLRKDGTVLKELRSPMLVSSTGILVAEAVNKTLAVNGSLLLELEL